MTEPEATSGCMLASDAPSAIGWVLFPGSRGAPRDVPAPMDSPSVDPRDVPAPVIDLAASVLSAS